MDQPSILSKEHFQPRVNLGGVDKGSTTRRAGGVGAATPAGEARVTLAAAELGDARLTKVWRRGGDGVPDVKTINKSGLETGGEAGIRTLDTTFGSYNGLANRRLQPLGHLTAWS